MPILDVNRRTLAVVSGALVAGGALAYARSGRGQRRRSTEAANGGDALARNGERLGHSGTDGRVAGTKRRKSALKSLHFLAAILLKKIGPNGTRYLLGLILTAVSFEIFWALGCARFDFRLGFSELDSSSTQSMSIFLRITIHEEVNVEL